MQGAEIMPLHSSLGDRAKPCLKKKKKKRLLNNCLLSISSMQILGYENGVMNKTNENPAPVGVTDTQRARSTDTEEARGNSR